MRRKSINIHERFLRHIWDKQYLKTGLKTLDGNPLNVFNVGLFNPDGGPDFKNAKIKIGSTTYAGDVEIHRTVFDWLQHQHQEDPKYNSVVLHVVLEADGKIPSTFVNSGRRIPVLVLGQFLSESIHTVWQKAILDERSKRSEHIHCYEKNDYVSLEILDHWLSKLAVERLEIKLRRFEERLKQLANERRMILYEHKLQYGEPKYKGKQEEIPPPLPELTQKDFSQKELWEQILYEGLMEGLGYSKNREPFIKLAKNLTLRQMLDWGLNTGEKIEAILFGAAGLLPPSTIISDKEASRYISELRKHWKEFRSQYHGELLNKADWQFFPTRPTNFPTIRIAAAVGIINSFLINDLFRKSIQILKDGTPATNQKDRLIALLNIKTNDFWKSHYHFYKPTSKQICTLGISRIHELIINAVLPVALLYARIFKDRAVREGVLNLYRILPATESNSITRLMEKQLLKNRLKVTSVCRHQAIIQLYKYYCTENRCTDCEIGKTIQVIPTHSKSAPEFIRN